MADDDPTIAALKREIELRNERIKELTKERDEERKLVKELRENVQDYLSHQERMVEAFHMVIGDDGKLHWAGHWCPADEYGEILDKYNALVGKWNKYLPLIRGVQEIGRPLEASDAQCVQVLKLRKAGISIRKIAFETNLGVRTVRTIIGREDRSDRTSKKRFERVQVERQAAIRWRARTHTRKALPKQMAEWEKNAMDLSKR